MGFMLYVWRLNQNIKRRNAIDECIANECYCSIHAIIYRCMLHLLSTGDVSQEYYRAMMHHRHNTDGCSICYQFIMHLTTASIKHLVNMRPQISFYQHFVTARARCAIGLKPSVCFDYKMKYIIYMLLAVKLMIYALLDIYPCYQCMTCFRYMIHAILVNQCMLLIYACYRCKIHTVHAIDWYCMLHMLSITDTCYELMMHPENDVDQWMMLIIIVSMNDVCSSCYQSMIHAQHVLDLLCISTMLTYDTVLHWDHQYHSLSTLCDGPSALCERFKAYHLLI